MAEDWRRGKRRGPPAGPVHRCRFAIRFVTGALGWEHDEHSGRRVFPRQNGNILFPRRYWHGIIGRGIREFYDDFEAQHPHVSRQITVDDTLAFAPALDLTDDFDQVWEVLPVGFELSVVIFFPKAAWSVASFTDFLNGCGRMYGWAPVGSQQGYGKFQVVETAPFELF